MIDPTATQTFAVGQETASKVSPEGKEAAVQVPPPSLVTKKWFGWTATHSSAEPQETADTVVASEALRDSQVDPPSVEDSMTPPAAPMQSVVVGQDRAASGSPSTEPADHEPPPSAVKSITACPLLLPPAMTHLLSSGQEMATSVVMDGWEPVRSQLDPPSALDRTTVGPESVDGLPIVQQSVDVGQLTLTKLPARPGVAVAPQLCPPSVVRTTIPTALAPDSPPVATQSATELHATALRWLSPRFDTGDVDQRAPPSIDVNAVSAAGRFPPTARQKSAVGQETAWRAIGTSCGSTAGLQCKPPSEVLNISLPPTTTH
ncbi:MAG TPA: hypothetical protein VG435_17020 [Acidimicrobiales bacterium]|nr:hypothetical protein [Acidimicrobiales bacterium]